MASPEELMALGMAHSLARREGLTAHLAVTGAGTAQTDATALTGSFVEVGTAGSSTGVILQDGPSFAIVYNGGSNALKVYPPVGSYMNGTQNAAFSVTNAKTGVFMRTGVRWIGILSA